MNVVEGILKEDLFELFIIFTLKLSIPKVNY